MLPKLDVKGIGNYPLDQVGKTLPVKQALVIGLSEIILGR
jgi:hypothetical protein